MLNVESTTVDNGVPTAYHCQCHVDDEEGQVSKADHGDKVDVLCEHCSDVPMPRWVVVDDSPPEDTMLDDVDGPLLAA